MNALLLFSYITTAGALVSGLMAVGSGRHWDYTTKDIFLGRENALLYVWVMFSTIFSLCHLVQQFAYGLTYHFQANSDASDRWFALNAFMGLLMISAHIFVYQSLRHERDGPNVGERFIWGKRSRVS